MIEGWIARTHYPHAMYWIIKGYNHPDYGFVAVPYRLGNNRVDIRDTRRIVPESMFRYVECIGRYTVVLPSNIIDLYIDPGRALAARKEELPSDVMELLDQLGPAWAGLTGSWATFNEEEESDVDILIYNYNNEIIYDRLVKLKNEGLISNCDLRRKYRLNIPRQHGFQLLDACYKGTKYTIRILRSINTIPCSNKIIPIGEYRGLAVITHSKESYLVPATYNAILEGIGEVVIETWHTRYQEIKPGVYRVSLSLSYDSKKKRIIASPDIYGFIKGDRASWTTGQ